MTAKYNDIKIYVYRISLNKQYVLASYTEDGRSMFKINLDDLTDMSQQLQAELNKEG